MQVPTTTLDKRELQMLVWLDFCGDLSESTINPEQRALVGDLLVRGYLYSETTGNVVVSPKAKREIAEFRDTLPLAFPVWQHLKRIYDGTAIYYADGRAAQGDERLQALLDRGLVQPIPSASYGGVGYALTTKGEREYAQGYREGRGESAAQ